MKATLSAILACLLCSHPAIAAEPAAAVTSTATLQPGKTFERCLKLKQGDSLSYTFEADGDLRFNIHFHGDEGIQFPVPVSVKAAGKGAFKPEAKETYCMMWNNAGKQAVSLALQYQVD